MGRNAAQLRAAAIATGWFDGPNLVYVGDGYTVPWQTGLVAGPGWGGAMWLYKAYLDRSYPHAARLHDWLYTPYGPDLIQATQEEADDAIREELQAHSPIDATIVYTACSTFGRPYFGVSTVGYAPPSTPPSGDNMEPAVSGSNGPMADFKVVMVFQQTSVGFASEPSIGYVATPRTGGWSESYWDANTNLATVLSRLKGPRSNGAPAILPSRARVLNDQARILGARIYEAGGGRGQFYPMAYAGGSSQGDQPSVALLCASTHSGTVSTRRFTMRGIPDLMVVGGEFSPASTYTSALATYFYSLQNTSIRGRITTPQQEIFDITVAGLVTARVPLNYAVGAIVQIVQTLDESGNRVSGEFAVEAIGPLQNQLRVTGWTAGKTRGGKIGQTTLGWFDLGPNDTKAVRITNHKVGRPFAGYRGRNTRAQ
jgi:hypothetical protein